jgi:hypothetical protein
MGADVHNARLKYGLRRLSLSPTRHYRPDLCHLSSAHCLELIAAYRFRGRYPLFRIPLSQGKFTGFTRYTIAWACVCVKRALRISLLVLQVLD